VAALEALSRANQRFGEAFEVGLGFGRRPKHLTNHRFMASKLIQIVQGNTIQKHQPGNASKNRTQWLQVRATRIFSLRSEAELQMRLG
jgi:hypothetical protein